jgi:hypothetical protein
MRSGLSNGWLISGSGMKPMIRKISKRAFSLNLGMVSLTGTDYNNLRGVI